MKPNPDYDFRRDLVSSSVYLTLKTIEELTSPWYGCSWAHNDEIAERRGKCIGTVTRHIRQLIELDLMEVKNVGGERRLYPIITKK